MSSRERILASVLEAQPKQKDNHEEFTWPSFAGDSSKFAEVLQSIGGRAVEVKGFDEIQKDISGSFSGLQRIVSTVAELNFGDADWKHLPPQALDNVDLAIIPGHFGVAENSSVWVTEDQVIHRVLTFICQNLAIVIRKSDIVSTMHHAYDRIQKNEYTFGTFIAGPSKTADIEQSLVLGAHGPKSLVVYLLD